MDKTVSILRLSKPIETMILGWNLWLQLPGLPHTGLERCDQVRWEKPPGLFWKSGPGGIDHHALGQLMALWIPHLHSRGAWLQRPRSGWLAVFAHGGGDWGPKMGFLRDDHLQLVVPAPQEFHHSDRSFEPCCASHAQSEWQRQDRVTFYDPFMFISSFKHSLAHVRFW